MAEAVVLALGKISISLAGAAISDHREQGSIIKELPGKVKAIEAHLSIINCALEQQVSAYLNDNAYMKWTAYIRNLAYQVEDVMDRYSFHAHQLENRWLMWRLIQEYHGPFRSIYEEITLIEKNLKDAIELKQSLLKNYGHLPQQIGQGLISEECFINFPNLEKDLVGMDDNRRLMTEWLHSSDPDSTFITLLGQGGLGNTSLARDVYEREKRKFLAHAFMVVERDSTVDALLRKILYKIGSMEELPLASIDNIQANELKEEIKRRISKLKDGRCLIVLDNVRDPKIYLELRDVMSNLAAIRIIITTRKTQVAAARDPSSRFLQLQQLSPTDAFCLFCRKAFRKLKNYKCPSDLKNVATSIVNKCNGQPLAIVIIGGLMSEKPRSEKIWNQMYVRLESEVERNADHIDAILNLSYHDMPGDLRNCLLYCSMFPEDYNMSRESLVRLWVAEGSVLRMSQQTQHPPEHIAEEYFMQLINRNMLQEVDNDAFGMASTCKMHDIVRKMVLMVAKEERFSSATDFSTISYTHEEVRHLSLFGWKDRNTPELKIKRLRSLVALGASSCFTKLLSAIFSGSNFLTVLVLQDSAVIEIPASIGDLFNLRYISLWRTQVKSLPESIQKLSCLETLDVRQTKIKKLPQGIGKARKLRHILADSILDGSRSDFRSSIALEAPKGLTNFGELQTLETVQANKDLSRKLVKIVQLRRVSIDNISSILCAELLASLSELESLNSLLLSATDENEVLSFQNLMPKSNCLRRLTVRGSWSGRTLDYPIFKQHGGNLRCLYLSWCHVEGDPLHFLGSHCRYLEYLCLHRVQSANSLALPERCFLDLKNLVLERMPDVSQLKVGDGALKCIEAIYITALPKLDKVPRGIESLSSLKKLFLLDLHNDFIADWEKNEMNQKMPHGLELRI